jgi:hypothetical protein
MSQSRNCSILLNRQCLARVIAVLAVYEVATIEKVAVIALMVAVVYLGTDIDNALFTC